MVSGGGFHAEGGFGGILFPFVNVREVVVDGTEMIKVAFAGDVIKVMLGVEPCDKFVEQSSGHREFGFKLGE